MITTAQATALPPKWMRRFHPEVREWIYCTVYDTLVLLGAFDERAADYCYERMRLTWNWRRSLGPSVRGHYLRWYLVIVPRDRYREILRATLHLFRWLTHRLGRMIGQ